VVIDPSKQLSRGTLACHQIAPSDADTKRHDPYSPTPGQPQHIAVINAAPYQALRNAICSKDNFQRVDGSPYPTAELKTSQGNGYAQLKPAVVDDQQLLPSVEGEALVAQMWEDRKDLSDVDADALDLLASIWIRTANAPQDDAVADIDEMLSMRGIKPKRGGQGRRGGYEPEQRSDMLRALSHIQNIWLHMGEIRIYVRSSSRKRLVTQTIESRPFVIKDRMGQYRLLETNGSMDVRKFIFQPGLIFAHFLLGSGRQTALLAARALVYNPRTQKWEKRLTRYLSYLWRCRARSGEFSQPLRVATIFAQGLHLPINTRRLSKMQDRLVKCLDTLQGDRIIADWQYGIEKEGLCWPESTVLIEPPDQIREHYEGLIRCSLRRKPVPVDTCVGNLVMVKRQETGLSQSRLAELVGMSPAAVSNVERGLCKAPKRLQNWLFLNH